MKYDELRQLARYASPGPWTNEQDHVYQARGWELAKTFNLPQDRNAAYIAAASPDVILTLLDERERLREALKRAASHVPQGAPDALYDLNTYIWPLLKDEPAEATR